MNSSSLTGLLWAFVICISSQWGLVQSRREPCTAFLSTTRSPRLTRQHHTNIHSGWSFRPINTHTPALHYSTDGKISIDNKVNDKDDKNGILPDYQTVAEQAPLWYETFVINVLGADTAKEIGLPPPVSPTKFRAMQQQKSLTISYIALV